MAESDMTAQEWNKKGNEEFTFGKRSKAISHYTKAIELATDDAEKGLYYDNRAAAYFKTDDYDKGIKDCNNVLKLEIYHNFCITLIRRLFALIELENFEQAYQNLNMIISSCSNDTSCSNHTLPQDIIKQFCKIPDKHIKNKISQITNLAFNVRANKEERQNAMIALLILVHWRTAYEIFIKEVGENDKVICSAIRIVNESCENNGSCTKSVMNAVLPWCLEMMNSTFTERVNASEYCLLDVLNSGMNDEPDSKPDETLSKKHKKVIDKILSCLSGKIGNETTTGNARDTLIEFITRNIHYTALDWAKRLIELRGLQKLMEVAIEMMKFQNKISIDITSSTQALISMYLTEMYEKMICNDDDKKTFINAINEFIGDKLPKSDTESKRCTLQMRIILAITTLIFSPLDALGVESIAADVLPWCVEMMNSAFTRRIDASQNCLQTILNIYSGINDDTDSKHDRALCKKHEETIDEILSCVLDKIERSTTTGIARDALIEFITRNIHYTASHWAEQLYEFGCLEVLIEVASQCQSVYCSLDYTSSTKNITSVCLAKIEENLNENDKEKFFKIINEFIREELEQRDVGFHMRAVVATTVVILGPFNVANAIITEDGFDDMIFDFLEEKGNNLLLKKMICEFIYAVVTKYDEFNKFIERSFTILQKLCYLDYPNVSENMDDSENVNNSENLDNSKCSHDSEHLKDSIRIRAFVGTWKMTKFEVLKEELQAVLTFDKEQIGTWLKVCKRFLTDLQRDMRKWAVEGLSYLTLDLGAKDDLIRDQQAVRAIIEFAKTENESILYQVDILLVNLCSAYDKEDLIPKMETFVNYFDVKNQILAEDSFVGKRRRVLAEAGVTSALVSLAQTGSENSKELIARIFNSICSEQDLRELVVEEGGTETLLSLALSSTNIGKINATRALIYLVLTAPPEVAFPNQIIMEVVQPILNLLNPERSVNERCDALTALCNLASVNDSMREHIFKEVGFEKIEDYMHDDNNMLKRTSIQLINNLVSCREVAFQLVEQRSDQLQKLIMWSMVEHETNDYIIHATEATARMIVTLTAASEEACVKLHNLPIWQLFLRFLLYNRNDDLQHKGTEITLNMMKSTKDVAEDLIKEDIIMSQVRALSNNDIVQNKEIKKLASLVLEAAAKWDIINGNVKGNEPLNSIDNTGICLRRLNLNNYLGSK